MQVAVAGKQLDLGDALREHTARRLEEVVGKYFDEAIEAHVVFSREAHLYRADCSVHIGAGMTSQAAAEADEVYASLDAALVKLEKQLRRDKRRRRDHHAAARRRKPSQET
jgi:ribosomal subunit interface protein